MFYNINSKEFGEKLKQTRSDLKLSQAEVSSTVKLSVDTLRRIENGYVTPRFETLVKLSHLYKTNLIDMLASYSKLPQLEKYYDDIFTCITENNYSRLEELKKTMLQNLDSFIQEGLILIEEYHQLDLFCEASLKFIKNTDDSLIYAKATLLKALQISNPTFSLENIKESVYTQFEIRLLHLLALIEKRLKRYDNAIRLIQYILEANVLEKNDVESIKNTNLMLFTLSYCYFEKEDHLKSLKISNEAIHFSIKHNRMNELHLHYYRKGIAEYLLGHKSYMKSLQLSIHLLESIQSPLAETYRDITKKVYDLTIF